MGSRGREDSRQGGSWRTQQGGGLWNGAGRAVDSTPQSHTRSQINREEQRAVKQTLTQDSSAGK